ncbi:MAG: hypothetical protein LPL29_12570 [Alphaproteobacteria bacterium]|nr:hypothetical protein [Alphaproteobacteria bacterium]MDX5416448.1 hypothetical protein [Alphaproteobacteria bacterium]
MQWSDFRGDPYGWASNQGTHILIGAATAAAWRQAGAEQWWAFGAAVFVWAVWEAVQFLRLTGEVKRRWRDAVVDMSFFAWGALYTGPESWAIIGMIAVAVGYVSRRLA